MKTDLAAMMDSKMGNEAPMKKPAMPEAPMAPVMTVSVSDSPEVANLKLDEETQVTVRVMSKSKDSVELEFVSLEQETPAEDTTDTTEA